MLLMLLFQISENGLLVLNNEKVNSGKHETYPYPQPLDDEVFQGSGEHIIGMVAPFWADTSSSSLLYKVFIL